MPIYEYRPLTPGSCEYCQQGFDQLQKIQEPVLSICPKCETAVKRVISAPNLAKPGPSLDPANLDKHGFTQYRKSAKGVYEKTAGKGPNIITDD